MLGGYIRGMTVRTRPWVERIIGIIAWRFRWCRGTAFRPLAQLVVGGAIKCVYIDGLFEGGKALCLGCYY